MAYRFKHSDDSIQDGVRRIALDQIDAALGEIDDRRLDAEEAVHQLRKRCKKLRGLIRLVQPAFGDYKAENAAFREAADALSFIRDTAVMITTYDKLLAAYRQQVERATFAQIRRHLTLRQNHISRHRGEFDERLARARAAMVKARKRARHWRLNGDGFDALAGGLTKNYKRAAKALAAARQNPIPAAFHEWRKRVKYHGYHTRLLTPVWPGTMKMHGKDADRLGDLLGDHHDLEVFRQALAHDPNAFGELKSVEVMIGLIRRRQAVLEADAFALGSRLLAEPEDALLQRWHALWDIWQNETPPEEEALAA
jgi:CHAD domain-containing protein